MFSRISTNRRSGCLEGKHAILFYCPLYALPRGRLLDEIDVLGLEQQASLLRVIETGEFEPVGSNDTQLCRARIVAASNRDLEEASERGQFRRDLYYRLNVMSFYLPPLRDRIEDIAPLARGMAARFNARFGKGLYQINSDVIAMLEAFPWPGNIRQLENAIERACVTSRDSVIQVDNLPPDVVSQPTPEAPFHVDLRRPLPDLLRAIVARVEKRYLHKALRKARGNVGRCAKICGLPRRSITAKIADYKLDRSAYKDA